MIKNIFKNLDSNDNEFVEKIFVNTNYRKIRKDLIQKLLKQE